MKTISQLFPGSFEAIPKANYVRDNKVSYKVLPEFYGCAFCRILITDSRYANEILFVATKSLY